MGLVTKDSQQAFRGTDGTRYLITQKSGRLTS